MGTGRTGRARVHFFISITGTGEGKGRNQFFYFRAFTKVTADFIIL